ncbi:hypothetical protein JNB_13128 [Janibacter sp. HTCC2649]|uniref:hypothetical protein n=1 Tax=Janibacter sp. HTCC2649 TaxID=313589 RepID=UPI0000671A7B|nr:hypothetical protein [Janibacter sp. HTCC2649]EAP97908.1 hypothetical protein JNB_13128 [Janibacter sp. HTCC2649]
MWPWLMIAVGVLLVVGGLVARHRMMRDHRAQLAEAAPTPTTKPASVTKPAPTPEPARSIPFPDRPASHRLTSPPMLRARSSDVPLLDWLRYYSDGNAWSGVIQSIADRISGDQLLKPWFGSMDRPTLQRHVMSIVMELTGEGLTVGTVRRLADAHVQFVAAGGAHITEPVWDKLHAPFANALREHLVPESAVLALEDTLAPLKAVIVTRSDSHAG